MADVEPTQPATADHVETSIDDGDDAESNVRLWPTKFATRWLISQISQEILLMKQRVAEMEREANKLRELQAAAEQEHSAEDNGGSMETDDDKANTDNRSVYVGNVGLWVTNLKVRCWRSMCNRSIMEPLQKRSKATSRLAGQLTE